MLGSCSGSQVCDPAMFTTDVNRAEKEQWNYLNGLVMAGYGFLSYFCMGAYVCLYVLFVSAVGVLLFLMFVLLCMYSVM